MLKQFIKRLLCRHEWERIKNTVHMIHGGMSKGAKFKCEKCGKIIWSDIFSNKVNKKNKYVFKEFKKEDISDGYHTFKQLYFQRMMLFSVICNTYKDNAWKSKLHSDNTMFDDYFIVGIDTPEGNYTYHYELKYWDMFECKELDNAPEWDGHTEEDVDRLFSLMKVR